MTARTPRLAIAALGVTAAGILATPDIASASTGDLEVTSVAAPAWAAHEALPVSIVIHNSDDQVFCNQVLVTTRWVASNGAKHATSMLADSHAGVFTGTMTIPARWVRAGRLRYSVSAEQNCGFLTNKSTYIGRTGWKHTTVA